MLYEPFSVEYNLTQKKSNQDSLRNLFGCERQMHGSYDHANAVIFKFMLKKLLLANDVALLFEKANTCGDDKQTVCLSVLIANNEGSTFSDKDLAEELYITSICFEVLDIGYAQNNYVNDENDEHLCFEKYVALIEHECKSTDFSKGALRYIWGILYISFV